MSRLTRDGTATTHAYISIYTVGCTLNSRLLSGHLGFVAGTLRGSLFPVWFGGCATYVTLCSVPGYSDFTMCSEKSEHSCLTSYWYNAAILVSLFFIRVFKEVLSSEFVE